ncbi:DUF5590 domain-containing protein [Cohnella suwonensis]|uniref:DUF5590 domain-containing protein n=1 Tax=Cohnella suwonensis TaxID=696072 RepID=A0ABW0LQW4_9BACL
MNLSRTEGHRKGPSLSLAKWGILVAGFVVFVLVCFYLYVRSSDKDYRSVENRAVRIAKQQAGLKEVTDAASHTWDETVWIVSGKDADGESWVVFEKSDGVVKEKTTDNLTKKQMLAKFESEHEGASAPIRMIPGWFKGQPAWEIRYWNNDDHLHQSLGFYSFKDGTMLKTYVLSS